MKRNTRTKLIALTSLSSLAAMSAASGQLRVDFSNTGATPAAGYEGYFADHEISETFTTQTYTALGATLSVTPIWGDDDPGVVPPIDGTVGNSLTGEPTSKQLITRSEATPNPDLYSDWIGVDTRGEIRNPGNPLRLVISGLPAGDYTLLSHHHDPQNQTGLIDISIDDEASVEFDQSAGGGAEADPAIYQVSFSSDGTNDTVITYSNRAGAEGREQGANDFVIINAIEIFLDGDGDLDGMPDSYETLNGLDPETNDADDDLDMDGLTNIQEYRGADGTPETGDETNPNGGDTDGDGLTDGDEVNTQGTNPLLADTDGDFFTDLTEVNEGTSATDESSFPISNDGLFIDFSALGEGGQTGPINDTRYLPYVAADRTADIASSKSYPTTAFGGNNTVTVEVSFPNPDGATTLPQTATRMIGRNNIGGYAGANADVIRDWIGFDNRGANGGNGPDADSAMEFSITGLPAGKYLYLSHHHDTGQERGDFTVTVTDASRTDEELFSKSGTSATQFNVAADADPEGLPSTSNFVIESSGPADPVVIRYASREITNAFEGFVVVNGLEITQTTDSDNDGIPDSVEDAIAGLDSNTNDSGLDADMDGLSNLDEYHLNTDLNDADTDDDDLEDGAEVTAGTNPFLADTDGDGINDGREVNDLMSDPLLLDSDLDGFSDSWEDLAGSDLADANSIPDSDLDGYSASREENDTDDAIFPMADVNQLFVDFNSNQGGGGDSTGFDNPAESDAFNNQPGYASYHANHEAIEELVTATYEAFGSSVTLTPKWPDSEFANTTQQSIGRGNGNNERWHGDQLRLLQDWLGVDTRTGQSGNGPFDGTDGNPTRLQLFLGNLPAFNYTWRSYHHDTENVHSGFLVEVSTDGGTTFTTIEGPNDDMSFPGTSTSPGGNPANPMTFTGAENGFIDPAGLPSTVEFGFAANGRDDVVVQFTPYTIAAVHRALFAINGFELTGPFGPGGGLRITSAQFDADGNYVIDFIGKPNTEYEVTKSLTLDDDFASISFQNDTDDSGMGTFEIPAAVVGDAKAFFRVEEFIE